MLQVTLLATEAKERQSLARQKKAKKQTKATKIIELFLSYLITADYLRFFCMRLHLPGVSLLPAI